MATAADPRLALMGGAPTQGNLRAVRTRAQDLQKSIDEVIFGLRFNAGALKWDDIIRKYSVINTQLAGLREALRPGTLDGFALLPRVVPEAGFAEAVAVQLASALTPEGEAAAEVAATAVDSALGLNAEMPSMGRFELLNSAVEAHNALISSLTGPAGAGGDGGLGLPGGGDGPLSVQGPLRKRQRELTDATTAVLSNKARAAAAAATALAAATSGPPPSAATGGGRQQAAVASAPQRRGPGAPPGPGPAGAAPGGGPGGGSEPLDPALVFMLSGTR